MTAFRLKKTDQIRIMVMHYPLVTSLFRGYSVTVHETCMYLYYQIIFYLLMQTIRGHELLFTFKCL